jgi:DNA-binding transcriptional MerR regulator
MGKEYRVQEFAKLAGITGKALRHYERVGLLVPRRSIAGYRLYSERHLDRLEQIVALKFFGPAFAGYPDGAGADSGPAA